MLGYGPLGAGTPSEVFRTTSTPTNASTTRYESEPQRALRGVVGLRVVGRRRGDAHRHPHLWRHGLQSGSCAARNFLRPFRAVLAKPEEARTPSLVEEQRGFPDLDRCRALTFCTLRRAALNAEYLGLRRTPAAPRSSQAGRGRPWASARQASAGSTRRDGRGRVLAGMPSQPLGYAPSR